MKQLQGIVVSAKVPQSAQVEVKRFRRHPIYKKIIRRTKKYLVQADLKVKAGDKVIIQECRPLSKRKRFRIIKLIQ